MRLRHILPVALTITFVVLAIVIGLKKQEQKLQEQARLAEEQRIADSIRVVDSIAHVIATSPKWQYTELQAGEGVFQVLKRLGFSHTLTMNIINKLRFEVELINLRVGERFAAKYSPDSTIVMELQYMPNRVQKHRLLRDTLTDSISYILEEHETDVRQRLVSGELAENSTLNQSLLDAGIPSAITQVVNNVLACKVAFRTDARVHDEFNVLLQEEYYQDTLLPERTKILYASYKGVRAGFNESYRFEDTVPKSTYNAHYTREGEALIFSGLRYPVDRLHISSPYGMRIHPVTGRRKLHAGIDYAGPIGTNIYAVAPGKVVVSGYDKYSGNKVAIKHADGSQTYYLHLNRKLVKKGQQVRSRQLIGKMGKTGRVTGPHLHFGVKKPNGQWMNPSHKRMIATPKLKGSRLELLKKQIAEIDLIRAKLSPAEVPAAQ